MALKDLGFVDFEEPFLTFRKHGLLIKEGSKMSKSRGNVVIPDQYIEKWGADTFRTYLMFLGPYQEGGDFRDQGLQGPYGLLSRTWDCIVPADRLGTETPPQALERKLHQTIRKVTEDIGALRYNTAIAALMEYLNAVREGGRKVNRAEVEPMVPLLAPFAPHIAEELWERLGHEGGIFSGSNWPAYDEDKTRDTAIEVAVQVNGKLRARLPLPVGATEAQARDAALSDENVRRHVGDKAVRKVIYVPDRLLNLVVG
jgi:leucyl-tRNA synthetase